MTSGLFLGDKFFAWMMLAFGAALVVGNLAALVRRPADLKVDAPDRPPPRRVIPMISIGLLISIWAFASLVVK